MDISVKFFEKNFSSEHSKDAYLKACKWLAKYIISKVEIGETFWKIDRLPDTDLPTFKLELHAMLKETDFRKAFCDTCKSFHSSFYLNQQYNCDRCNMTSYYKQAEKKLEIKRQYRVERLKYIMEKRN